MAMTKIKGLQQWCRRMADGYAHVDVANFTTAWRDGMAFCAIIHRFRPDLIDYDSLSPDNVYENCKLAFEVAEKELDIPAFLEAEDMARLKVPDKLSVITYVSQYYNFLHALPQLGGPGVKGKVSTKSPAGTKRPPNIDTSQAPSTKKAATGEDGKENVTINMEKPRQGTVGDKCNICGNRVYLLERHIEASKLYHRSCYRHSELSPTNKVYTRSPFLSPSLSGETPPLSPSHLHTSAANSSRPSTPVSHHSQAHSSKLGLSSGYSGQGSDSRLAVPSSSKTTSSDSPRKTDSGGTKHTLAEPDREDSKKSRLQPKALSSEDHQKANAIRDRLKNLKDKYEVAKNADEKTSDATKPEAKSSVPKEKHNSGVFPLSGKESRRLEKRKEQMINAEKQAEQSSRGGARNVPLIFQQKNQASSSQPGSASSVLSASSKPSSHASHVSVSSSSTHSTISSTPVSSKTSLVLNIDKPENKTAQKNVKTEFLSKKDETTEVNKSELNQKNKAKVDSGKSVANKKPVLDIRDNEKADIASLQKKFAASEDSGSTKPLPHPVAKARTHITSNTAKHDSNQASTLHLKITPGKASASPKAAPRKILHVEHTADKKTAPERPKFPPGQLSPRETDQPLSARTSGSESPPPLPSTAPPPLPTSPPPSLSSAATATSATPAAKIRGIAQNSKDSSLTKTNPGAGNTKIDPAGTRSSESEEVSTHGPVKSKVAVSTEAVANTSAGKQAKRWSSPAIHSGEPTLSVFASEKDQGEKQVLSGLLVSLAGVRGRAGSVPGVTALTSPSATSPSDPPLSLVKPSPSSPSSSSHTSAPAKDTTLKIPVAPSQTSFGMAPKDSGHSSSHSVSKSQNITPFKNSEPQKKITNGPRTISPSIEKVPEALNVLSNLKKVDPVKQTQSKDKKVDPVKQTQSKDKKVDPVKQTQSQDKKVDPVKQTQSQDKKVDPVKQTQSKDNKVNPVKQTQSKDTHTKADFTTNKVSTLSASDKNGKTNITAVNNDKRNHTPAKPAPSDTDKLLTDQRSTETGFNAIKLKHVSPESKQNTKVSSTAVFDIQLKRVEKRPEDAPVKPSLTSSVVELGGDGSGGPVVKPVKEEAEPPLSSFTQVKARDGKGHQPNTYEEDDMPDWKAALEKRKQKLRSNIVKSEFSTVDNSQLKEKGDDKGRTKSEGILASAKNERNNNLSKNAVSEPNTKSPREQSASPRDIKRSDTKPEVSTTSLVTSTTAKKIVKGGEKSDDWKHDAEMKIAALGGFESEEEEKEVTKPKRVLPKVPDSASTNKPEPKAIQGKDEQKANAKKKENEKAKAMKNNAANDNIEAPKDSVPEFLAGKSRLKHIDLDSEGKPAQPVQKPKKDQDMSAVKDKPHTDFKDKDTIDKDKPSEDFRDKLHNLKHVQGAGEAVPPVVIVSGEKNAAKQSSAAQLQQNHRTKLTKPLSLGISPCKNTNNNMVETDVPTTNTTDTHTNPLLETINLASSPDVSDNEDDKERDYSEQRHSTPITENGKTTPKTKKKKIPFFGKKKKEKSDSPSESPIPNTKKKIEAPTDLNFDKSTDLEMSLPDATAMLSLEDRHTPTETSHKKVLSPKHISAIELQQQLLDIDSRLTDLELRGRDLEDSIRNVNVLEEDDDSLMIKWFELVSEKNDLVRQEADLVYMSREQDLETDQEHIESQLRYLMGKPDEEKSAAEREEEEYLIQRKLELVEQRNRIVDSMDEDRLRYEEEDRDIEVTLRDKGFWKDSSGTLIALKGKKVSRSTFYT